MLSEYLSSFSVNTLAQTKASSLYRGFLLVLARQLKCLLNNTRELVMKNKVSLIKSFLPFFRNSLCMLLSNVSSNFYCNNLTKCSAWRSGRVRQEDCRRLMISHRCRLRIAQFIQKSSFISFRSRLLLNFSLTQYSLINIMLAIALC